MKRVNIAINEKMHLKAKVAAALKNKALNDYIVKAIEELVEKDKKLLEQ